MLSPRQLREFNERGYVSIERAFAADAAEAMVRHIWASLGNRFGVSRTDPTSWKLPLGLKVQSHPWLLHSPALNCGPEPRFMLLPRIRFDPNPSHGNEGQGRGPARRSARGTS